MYPVLSPCSPPLLRSSDLRRLFSLSLCELRRENAPLVKWMEERYKDGNNADSDDAILLEDRLVCYSSIVSLLPLSLFSSPLCVVCSPGRVRLLMGHTDFIGLGGHTIDGTTKQEIICACQVAVLNHDHADYIHSSDPYSSSSLSSFRVASAPSLHTYIHIINQEPDIFPSSVFSLDPLLANARVPSLFGDRVYSPSSWLGYVNAFFTYLMSEKFDKSKQFIKTLEELRISNATASTTTDPSPPPSQVHLYFCVGSPGLLSLPHAGGLSSSAALSGAIAFGLSRLLGLAWTTADIADLDYCEYYLGKRAGCNDKLAQLFAAPGRLVVLASEPPRYLGSLVFPKEEISFFMAESPVPRLSHESSLCYLLSPPVGLQPGHAYLVYLYSQLTMEQFSSRCYQRAVAAIVSGLRDARSRDSVGVTEAEAAAVLSALEAHDGNGNGPLLRELLYGGRLGRLYPHYRGWSHSGARYSLIQRLLLLVPERERIDYSFPIEHIKQSASARGVDISTLLRVLERSRDPSQQFAYIYPRSACLYGLSEVERGHAWLREINEIQQIKQNIINRQAHPEHAAVCAADGERAIAGHMANIIEYVNISHEGDRAVYDYRQLQANYQRVDRPGGNEAIDDGLVLYPHMNPFVATSWAATPHGRPASPFAEPSPAPLHDASTPLDLPRWPGSFQRSSACCDSLHTALIGRFSRTRVTARVSAAGLSGRMMIYCGRAEADRVREAVESEGWKIYQPIMGTHTQTVLDQGQRLYEGEYGQGQDSADS